MMTQNLIVEFEGRNLIVATREPYGAPEPMVVGGLKINFDWLKEIPWKELGVTSAVQMLNIVLDKIVPLIEKANATVGLLVRTALTAVRDSIAAIEETPTPKK